MHNTSPASVASEEMGPTHYLVSFPVSAQVETKKTEVIPATNHIFAIDCSGSMYSELPKIREQLKNKLASLIREKDVVTIIWFSGRGECGFIVKGVEIKSVQGLAALQSSVDRYLKTVGLTGFKEPLIKISEAIEEVTASAGIHTHSFMFLTDGYDNTSSTAELVLAAKRLSTLAAAAVFVEYGYYANKKLLLTLAEQCGGRVIFAESFEDFVPSFEQVVTNKPSGKPKKEITLPSEPKYDLAFTYNQNEGIIVYAVENGKLLVDDSVDKVFYHSTVPVGKTDYVASFNIIDFYASLVVLSQRMKSQDVYDTLDFLGDVAFTKAFINAFGKQNLYAFQNMATEVVLGQRERMAEGQDFDFMPSHDAYTLLHLFQELMKSDENRFDSEAPVFIQNYKRIGAKKVAAVSREEARLQDELEKASQDYVVLAALVKKDASKRTLLTEAATHMSSLAEQLEEASDNNDVKFTVIPNPYGTPITSLTWNASRPNLSVLVRQNGIVSLPANEYGMTEVPSFRFRNYTLIRDGIVNVPLLPVYLSEESFNTIKTATELLNDHHSYDSTQLYMLDLTKLPIINRQMVTEVSAKELAELQYELALTQGDQSVFNFFQKENFPKVSTGFVEQYGSEQAEWLKSLGITDFNGFNPRVTAEKSGEMYMSTELNVKITGMASKPTAKDVWKKITDGKALTDREKLFERAMVEYKDFAESVLFSDNTENGKDLLKTFLKNKQEATVTKVREYLNQMARIKFSIILGQVWFKEFKDLDDNQLVLTVAGKPITFTFLLEDNPVEI